MFRKDFSEVDHTGGEASFKVISDENGYVKYQVGYSHSSPFPAMFIGVYADPDGFPCGNIRLGGIGQPFNPPPLPNCIPVLMASDSQGKFGHECPECKKHFRSDNIPADFPLTCPYCGLRVSSYRFLTPPQKKYIKHYADQLIEGCENIKPNSEIEIVIDMNLVADSVTEEPTPDFYYTSTMQQSEFRCTKCNCYNDIRGKYGYCSSCGTRNNLDVLRTILEQIRDQVKNGILSPNDAVKRTISEFDSAARDYSAQFAARVPMKEARINRLTQLLFHNLGKFVELMELFFGINLLKGIETDSSFLRMMFCRRHVYEHDGGVATERYLNESGDKSTEQGTLIRETQDNVHRLIGSIIKMLKNLDNDFHEIFKPEMFCIEIENERKTKNERKISITYGSTRNPQGKRVW